MTSWKTYKLGDILNFRRGHDLPKTEMVNGEIPVAGSNGVIGYHNVSTPIEPCITIGRSGNVGTPYIYDKCWAHNTVLYVDDFKGNDPLYLYYLLKTIPLASYGGGSAVPTLNRNHIHPIEIKHTPSLEEQRRIAGILGAIDDKIENNRRINTNLELQAQALFDKLICDENLKYEYIANLEHSIETGRRPKGGVANIANGVPSIGAENIKGLGKYDYSKTKYITEEFAQSLKKGFIKGYELLIYKDGGKPGYFIPNFSIFGEGFPYETMALNEHVFLLDFGDRGYNFFSYFFFQTEEIMRYLNAQGSKAAIPGINRNDVEGIAIPTIENKTVKEFCARAEPIITAILTNAKESSRLATLRDTLLPKLMNGEIITK